MNSFRIIYIYILLVCLSACLFICPFVSNKVKTTEQIRLKFCVGPHMTLGKGYGCWKLQKFVCKSFAFFKIFKMRGIFFSKSANFLLLFYIVKREDAHRLSGFLVTNNLVTNVLVTNNLLTNNLVTNNMETNNLVTWQFGNMTIWWLIIW